MPSLRKVLTTIAVTAALAAGSSLCAAAAEIDYIESSTLGAAPSVVLSGFTTDPDVIDTPYDFPASIVSALVGSVIVGTYTTASPDTNGYVLLYAQLAYPGTTVTSEQALLYYEIIGGVAEIVANFATDYPYGFIGPIDSNYPYVDQQAAVLLDVSNDFADYYTYLPTALPQGLIIKIEDAPPAPAPEPASVAILGIGLMGLGGLRRRRNP
jgi:hypothetical protein